MEDSLRNFSYLDIQDNPIKRHCIFIREIIIKRLTGSCDNNICKVEPGQLVETIGTESKDTLRVRLQVDVIHKWHNVEWRCNAIDLCPVSPLIWKLLCSVSNFQKRMQLVENEQFCKGIESIKVGSKVWYCPVKDKTLVTVKYIGSVPKLGTGYYFGVDIVNNISFSDTSSLETEQYTKTLKSPEIYATINEITPYTINLESIRNFEKNFLSNTSSILQPKNTDNFFSTVNKDSIVSKKSIDNLRNNKYSLSIDTDNNNPVTSNINFNISNYTSKNRASEDQEKNNKKKLDLSLRSFDPLNSEDDVDEEVQPKNLMHSIGFLKDTNQPKSHNASGYKYWSSTLGMDKNLEYIRSTPMTEYASNYNNCEKYGRSSGGRYSSPENPNYFDTPQIPGINDLVPFIKIKDNMHNICGKYRGIQGHHNSCYLDATLFSMFAFTNVFNKLLFRPPNENDCLEYEEVQRVLREEIVYPLRSKFYVPANNVMKLRTLLERSSSISGLTSEEKDPEEFLTSLLAQTLKAEPLLKLSSGQDAYHYQLFVEKDDQLVFPSVQQLLEQSFFTSNIKLKDVPSCLIIQMPRFGKSYKMYSKIKPTLLLDVTDIIENYPKQCTVCSNVANYECKECYGELGTGLQSTFYCSACNERVHCHERRKNHRSKGLCLSANGDSLKRNNHYPVRRLSLELLAVVCIETSHYVSFVKCGPGSNAPWCFFDSMADRKGEQNGHNIPEILLFSDLSYWLSDDSDDQSQPKYLKRLLSDAYMCMYQLPSK